MTVALLTFILIGAGHALFLALVIFMRLRDKRDPRIFLSLLLTSVSIALAGPAFYRLELYSHLPLLAETYVPFTFLIGPLLFVCLTRESESVITWRRSLRHATPFLLYHILLTPFYLSPAAEKVAFIVAALRQMPLQWKISTALFVMHFGIYLVVALRRLNGMAEASSPGIGGWLCRYPLAALATALWILLVFRTVMALSAESILFAPTSAAVAVFALGYVLLAETSPKRSRRSPRTFVPEKAQRERLLGHLDQAMTEEQAFTRPDLTLEQLAAQIEVPPHVLSRTINDELGRSFPDYVNGFRVDAACRMLSDPNFDHLTISAIAYEAGFGARSSFYDAFRKHRGVTPSEHRKVTRKARRK